MITVTKNVISKKVSDKIKDIDQNNQIRQAYKELLADEARSRYKATTASESYKKAITSLPGKTADGHITDYETYSRAYNKLHDGIVREINTEIYGDDKKKKKFIVR